MYQITCDDYVLYDPRIDDKALKLLNPKCKLEAGTAGSASFTIPSTHMYYDKLVPLKSVFEIKHNEQVIFRGRMINDGKDFHNKTDVQLEGVLTYANDSIIEPFDFPKDFPNAKSAPNIIEYFFRWVLEQHNAQVEEWKQLKPGRCTVTDPNNYITRASADYATAWDILWTKLADSGLGGYLVIRYEDDGNYVDYVDKFELTNVQTVTFGKNLLDLSSKTDASNSCSAILPLGAEVEETIKVGTGGGYEGDYVEIGGGTITKTIKKTITLEDLPDGDLTDDLVKQGKYIYSKSARAAWGWICAHPDDTTWKDVTVPANLQSRAIEFMTNTALVFSGSITVKAVDLSFTDEQIQAFRICRNILVDSPVHGIHNEAFPLTKLDIDIHNPQNTTITIGDAGRTMSGLNRKLQNNAQTQVEVVKYEVQEQKTDMVDLKNQLLLQNTQVINSCNEIILAALESYVETSNFEQYKETVSTQLQILSDEILMNFSNVTEHITDVDGDMQNRFTQIYDYIRFANGAITLGTSENAITLTVENDIIVFKKNGLQFGWWDGIDFHTGNIVVEVNKRAQFGNFAFIPRSDGSLMFLKVGG